MPWEVPVQVGDQTHSLQFENEPSQDDIDFAVNQLSASHQDQPSVFGSFARSAARNVAPAFVGGPIGGAIGSVAGEALAGAALGSEFPVVGNIVGGLIGAGAGIYALSKGQQAVANAIDPSASNPFSTASEESDAATNPWATTVGGLAIFRPSLSTLQNALKSTATVEGRNVLRQGYQLAKRAMADPAKLSEIAAENPAAYKAFQDVSGVAGNVGIGAAQGAVQGQSPQEILTNALGGALFNQSYLHGAGSKGSKKPEAELPHESVDVPKTEVASALAENTANTLDQMSGGTSHVAEVLRQSTAHTNEKVENQVVAPELAQAEEPAASAEGTQQPAAQNLEENPEAGGESLTPQENALPQPSPTEVFQREPSEVGSTGSERGGVEPSIQGEEAPASQQPEEPTPPPTEPEEVAPPQTTKIKDFDEYGNLSKETELPHDEAIRKLSLRKKYLELLHDCLG